MLLAEQAVDRARARGLTISDVDALIARWRERPSQATGVLFNWLALPGSAPSLAPSAATAVASPRRIDPRSEAESLRAGIVRAGRLAGALESEIDRRVNAALEHFWSKQRHEMGATQ